MKKQTRNDTKRRIIFAALTCIISIVLHMSYRMYRTDNQKGIYWNENNTIKNGITKQIQIECFDTLNFDADTTQQQVSIHNPIGNSCYMKYQIVLDGDILWQSDSIYPNYGFREITISKILEKGTYSAKYIVRCFDLETKKELNGINAELTIIVS